MEKRANVRDAQLKGEAPNVYIDDVDFRVWISARQLIMR